MTPNFQEVKGFKKLYKWKTRHPATTGIFSAIHLCYKSILRKKYSSFCVLCQICYFFPNFKNLRFFLSKIPKVWSQQSFFGKKHCHFIRFHQQICYFSKFFETLEPNFDKEKTTLCRAGWWINYFGSNAYWKKFVKFLVCGHYWFNKLKS